MAVPLVSVVVPGRNCRHTVRHCLSALLVVQDRSPIGEILFVDDGSTDDTAAIVAQFPVTLVKGKGRGAGAARNVGWCCAKHEFIWFVDADCVAEPDALDLLLPHFDDAQVAGAGGSYGNMNEDNLLACLIHEEIVARHAAMPSRVNFLATFNVVYRREVLEALGGFDERFLKGQDAEFAWRAIEGGHHLAFEPRSRVRHFHPLSWLAYLKTQGRQGYWRVWLHLRRRGHAGGDSYSGLLDHLQPPLAVAVLAAIPLAATGQFFWLCPALAAWLLIAQVPMTWRIVQRTRNGPYVWFVAMGVLRAISRGVGLTFGVIAVLIETLYGRRTDTDRPPSSRTRERGYHA